ncbi:MAG: sugar phosphate isomerase/epimerase family protein [Bryobacteraceae bacterium]
MTTTQPTRRSLLAAAVGFLDRSAAAWQIGCYTRPWIEYDYRVALDGMAEAGFKYAGLMSHKGKTRTVVSVETTAEEAAAIGDEVRKRGLQPVSIYGGEFGAAKGAAEAVAGLKRLIDNCAACRCPGLLLGGTRPALVDPYYKAVAECCGYAESKGVALSVKPHGGANATAAECRAIIEKVGHRNFRAWYDPGNIFFYSGGKIDPVDDVTGLNGLIAGMSIKDFRPPKDVSVTPGSGKVNFAEVLARAKRGGFTAGPLVVECLDPAGRAGLVAEARKARELLERLTA